ncbi:MAG: hypothetical protein OXK73_14810 [Rhodospirillaceae bacterium]|nr:hypothetical protein [Rhodospirillaceae bacterium]
MTERLEEAIAKVRKLPPDRQDEAAALLLSMVDQDSNTLRLTPQQATEVQCRLAQPTEYIPHDGVRAYNK